MTTTELISVELSDDTAPALVFSAGSASAADSPDTLALVGPRLVLPGTITATDAGWQCRIPLLASRWGGPALPPPSGRYRLQGVAPRSAPRHGLPADRLVPGLFRISFESTDAALIVTFSPPLADDEATPAGQARLEAEYRASTPAAENAVFFESFYGQNASCNPLAIDRALAHARPEITRYWGVADASVEVPPGAIAVVEGSAEWWRVRAAARLIVVNDWLRARYRKRAHQKVLQTWHGTMLKRLALSRRPLRPRAALATLKERARWDILLSQNPFATRIFRRAYAWFGAVWEEGYPRDDVLLTGDPARVRARLGVPEGVRVLLYAPTWRDDRPDHVDHLDVAAFAQELGDGYVTLIRGHSRTLRPGEDLFGGGVIDVTSYPDVSELFLAADALITDYSSVMFDFSVTGKPIYFFTPDLDRYRKVLRGFYFDLLEVAPGPVVQDADALVELIRHPDAVLARHAQRYAAWRERFNPRDDGRASERVVQRILGEGLLD